NNIGVLCGQVDLTWSATEVRDRFPIQTVWHFTGKVDLVVILTDGFFIHEYEFGDNRPSPQREGAIEVEHVPDDQAVVRVETNGVSLFVETPEVLVTTDQFLKH